MYEPRMIDCELTAAEKKFVTGCGASYLPVAWLRIPRWLSPGFNRCCDRHDTRYHYQYSKIEADWEMINCMYYNAYHSPWWQKAIKLKTADLVFWALNTKWSLDCYFAAGR